MNRWKNVFLCVRMNGKKALGTPKLYLVFIISFIFQYYTFSGLRIVSQYLGQLTTPWVFPFYITVPTMFVTFGGLAMLLFCDVPSLDGQAPFVLIRVGKCDWILGQMLYVLILSFIYTAWNLLCSILVLIPNVTFENEWGSILQTVASYPELIMESGASVSFGISQDIFEYFSPIQAMALSGGLYWLGTVFLGMIILCFYVLTGRMTGIAVCGFFVAFAYFSCYLGMIGYGSWIRAISPINWSSLTLADDSCNVVWKWSVLKYIVLILGLGVTSMIAFCRKDVVFTSRGR